MIHWTRMAFSVLVVLLPGGIVFLIAWALGRAYAARLKEAQRARTGSIQSAARALVALRPHDVWREARAVTGLPSPAATSR
ncbi:MAG TPA: hypothetical protein VE549_07280 [Myxococcaceae bacterium]|nr:hypothetical protein [Myxococcaceae bacterium]